MKKIFLFTFISILLSANVPLKTSGNLKIEITGLKNNTGSIKLSMFNSDSGFPSDSKQAFKIAKVEIKDMKAVIVFNNIPYGKYAIAFLHDENNNDKMDFNFGMPKESYGASNDATGFFGPPSFKDAAFDFNAEHTQVCMRARN